MLSQMILEAQNCVSHVFSSIRAMSQGHLPNLILMFQDVKQQLFKVQPFQINKNRSLALKNFNSE